MKDLDITYFLDEAIKEAKLAFSEDEVPVGAVLVKDGKIVAKGHNTTQQTGNKMAHAEINTILTLSKSMKIEHLEDYSLYVTLEPCVMCFGACNLCKLKEVIYILPDEKYGYSNSLNFQKTLRNLNILQTNYRIDEVKILMNKFFEKKRK